MPESASEIWSSSESSPDSDERIQNRPPGRPNGSPEKTLIISEENPQLVKDLIDQQTASWDIQKLQTYLLHMDVEVG
jgi:hypothetical protein